MTFQPGANVYTQGFGSRPENVEVPHIENRTPAPTDIGFPIGKRWIYPASDIEYTLTSLHVSQGVTTANWTELGTDSGPLNTLTGDTGGAETPSAGNITLAGTPSQITTAGAGSTITFSLEGPYTPATYTTHGVLLGEGTSSIVATAAGTNGQLLIGSTGADPAFSTVTSSGGTLTVTGGAHTLNLDIAAPVTVPNGGTGLTTLTAHDLYVGNGASAMNAVANGTTGQALVAATGADPAFGTLPVPGGGTGAITLTGVLTGNGTSAVTANAVTQHGVVLGGASNAVTSLAVAATGTVLAGATGANPAFTASPSVTGSVTAGTTLTATLGNITATNGNLSLASAGNKLLIHASTAANDSIGTATLTSGTVIVSTTAVTASSLIFLSYNNLTSPVACSLDYGTIIAGTSFVITSQDASDSTSTVNYWIVN